MKISLEWIADYLPGPLQATVAADALTNGGLPVEVIEKVGDDTVIDVEVTSNRGDCLSHVGVARELGALLKRESKAPKSAVNESATQATSVASVQISATQLCPHYTARVIRGVTIRPSPAWMQRRLEAVGVRPVNNVVDVTNFVMMEMGQPLHAFDFDKLAGGKIIVRTARNGETIVSIDGHERKLSQDMLVIADADKPAAVAGVMGGLHSEVSGKTVNVLLESARFDPLSVRKTARTLTLKSESSYRFERGIDPALPALASVRAAQLILELAGGELLKGVAEAGSGAAAAKTLSLRPARMHQLLGVELPTESVMDALTRLKLSPVSQGDRINVSIPSYRLDLNIEADLIEEAARVIGYHKIPVREEISIRVSPPQPELKTIERVRAALIACGYFEAVTVTFVPDALSGDFLPPGAAALPRADSSVRKADAHLRPSLVPSLLEAVRRNETAGNEGVKLFEIASTFWSDAALNIVERRTVGFTGSADLREVRGVVETLLRQLDADKSIKITPEDRSGFSAGVCAKIEWGTNPIGWIGQVSQSVCAKLDLRSTPCAAELDLTELLRGAQHVPQLHPLPRFPAVRRDLSLDVKDEINYDKIQKLVEKLSLSDLEQLDFVTTYRGKPLEKGMKSVTITLVFRSPTTTLTSDQVESSVQKMMSAAQSELGATFRK